MDLYYYKVAITTKGHYGCDRMVVAFTIICAIRVMMFIASFNNISVVA
jgi:hypothetical protein